MYIKCQYALCNNLYYILKRKLGYIKSQIKIYNITFCIILIENFGIIYYYDINNIVLSTLISGWRSLLTLRLIRRFVFLYLDDNKLKLTSIMMSYYYDSFDNYCNNGFNIPSSYFFLVSPTFFLNFILFFW